MPVNLYLAVFSSFLTDLLLVPRTRTGKMVLGIFCVFFSGRQNSAVRQYHVLFFGDEGERGWVLETTALPYAGRAAFDSHCQLMSAKLSGKERKNYTVAANRRRAWDVAVSSAEHAWMLSREQRIDEFIPPLSTTGGLGLSSNSCSRFGAYISEPTSHVSDSKLADGPGNTSATVSPRVAGSDLEVPSCGVAQEQFATFCRRSRKSLCLMHPGFTEDQIDRLLLMQWRESINSTSQSKYLGLYCLHQILDRSVAHRSLGRIVSRRV